MNRCLFTPTETLIIELLETGNTRKQIAECLNKGVRTVDTHIGRMFIKNKAKNATQLVHKYYQYKNRGVQSETTN